MNFKNNFRFGQNKFMNLKTRLKLLTLNSFESIRNIKTKTNVRSLNVSDWGSRPHVTIRSSHARDWRLKCHAT